MKKTTLIASLLFCIAGFANMGNAQSLAFRQGSFQINVTEGNTFANYITQGAKGEVSNHEVGCRDPLQLEYGVTSRIGLGISWGTDIYTVNSMDLYGISANNNQIKASTSEFTLDANYHFFVTHKLDIAAVLSYGGSGVTFKNNGGDYDYNYSAKGGILRTGLHGRFYFGHFGIVAMATYFNQFTAPQVTKGNGALNYNTTICGFAKEFGICYRFRK